MGIDARMLLRVKGYKPTDEQIAKWADALCRSIGAKHFFISDGLPPPEHHKASAAWHAAFNAHPSHAAYEASRKNDHFLSGNRDDSWRDHRNAIVADIGEHPEERRRAIEFTNYVYELDDDDSGIPVEYREPGRCYTQDAETIFAKPGEWLLTVSLWTRYYGVGYERGDLMTLCAVAEWCEVNIPNCEVWYGGDSSGVAAAPWPESARLELRKHLYSEQGRAYFDFDRFGSRGPKPSPCGLCVDGGRFAECGSGSNWTMVHCASCGKSFETKDGGSSWSERKEAA